MLAKPGTACKFNILYIRKKLYFFRVFPLNFSVTTDLLLPMPFMRLLAIFVLLLLTVSQPSIAKRTEQVEYPTYYAHVNGLSIAYQEFGDPENDTILLIMGLGGQLIHWDDDLVWKFVDAGFHVVRYDNRDAGWSSKLYEADTPGILTGLRYKLGMSLNAPYSLEDMADDGHALLEYLEIKNTHVVGLSMGGMIAQIMAAKYPKSIKTLTSIMSSSGADHLPPGNVELDTSGRKNLSREESIASSANIGQLIDGTVAELSEEEWKVLNARGYDRSNYPDGFARQLWAIADSGSRTELLKTISQPTLVIHGKADPLLPVEHGEHTAEVVPNSRLILIEGMGHYLDAVNKKVVIEQITKMTTEYKVSPAK